MVVNKALAVGARARGKVRRRILTSEIISRVIERHSGDGASKSAIPRLVDSKYAEHSLDELRNNYVTTIDLSQIVLLGVLQAVDQRCERLRTQSQGKGTQVQTSIADIVADFEVWAWGLSDGNLDLSEWYLKCPVRYLGVMVRRELADGVATGARKWHVDIEDRNNLKMIVYLNDVDINGGPFEYLDRAATESAIKSLRCKSGYIDEAQLRAAANCTEGSQVLGPRLTAALADICNLFHRQRPPTSGDRYSMTYTYCSTRPFEILREYLPNARRARSCEAASPKGRPTQHTLVSCSSAAPRDRDSHRAHRASGP